MEKSVHIMEGYVLDYINGKDDIEDMKKTVHIGAWVITESCRSNP